MNKKVVALIIAIIIVGVISGLIYVMYNQDENENETNNLGSINNAELTNDLISINGGTYLMGSPETEMQRETDEVQHEVIVSDFYIGRYEVTQKAYEEVIGENPSNFKGENLPVENVTWYEAIEYCNKLSKKDGLTPAYTIDGENVSWDRSANGYRLPTEAEWEFAAKGGASSKSFKYSGSNNLDDVAWHKGNSKGTPHTVGTKLPNELGVYDMSGNVWEWCWDWYNKDFYKLEKGDNPKGPEMGERRSVRGGSWDSQQNYVRPANRISTEPNKTHEFYGFRVVRTITK